MPTRRRFLTAAATAVIGTPAVLGGYTWLIEPHWLDITRRDFPSPACRTRSTAAPWRT